MEATSGEIQSGTRLLAMTRTRSASKQLFKDDQQKPKDMSLLVGHTRLIIAI
jgi:hypothetical protein